MGILNNSGAEDAADLFAIPTSLPPVFPRSMPRVHLKTFSLLLMLPRLPAKIHQGLRGKRAGALFGSLDYALVQTSTLIAFRSPLKFG